MRKFWVISAGVFLFTVVFVFSREFHVQGFNLLDDGLWLLGSRDVLHGKFLYREFFTIYGPARYYLLAAFMSIFGENAASLAIFKAFFDGCASVLLFSLLRGRRILWGIILIPFIVLALSPIFPRYFFTTLFALFLVSRADFPVNKNTPWLFVGIVWGLLTLFGVDVFLFSGAITSGFIIWQWSSGRTSSVNLKHLFLIGLGLVMALGPFLLFALFSEISGVVLWDTFVYPVERFNSGMSLSFWEALKGIDNSKTTFFGLGTGETLPDLFPGHTFLRSNGLRFLYLFACVVPIIGFWSFLRTKYWRLGPLVGLLLSGISTVAIRTDEAHLKAVLLSTIVLTFYLFSQKRFSGTLTKIFVVVFVLVLLPFTSEKAWVATHKSRDGIVEWERATAKIFLSTQQVDFLEKIITEAEWDPSSRALAWPMQPGLLFFSGAQLGHRQATMLPGEIRDARVLIKELNEADIGQIIIGPATGLIPGIRTMAEMEPAIWEYVRKNYSVDRHIGGIGGQYRLLKKIGETEPDLNQRPLKERLPALGQYVRSSMSPTIGENLNISQTFLMDSQELSGVSLFLVTPPPYPATISIRLMVSVQENGEAYKVLKTMEVNSKILRKSQRSYFSLEPILGTADKLVKLTILPDAKSQNPVRLLWETKNDENKVFFDRYPNGSAWVNGKKVEGDLYFEVW